MIWVMEFEFSGGFAGFFSPQTENTVLVLATVILGIGFENQPTEGVFAWYY